MPTTSNFGWTTPADTDLVKDGAAAIRTLGNGIDTSFLDLKGGTTGQVLSKASNTDLDFSWVAQDDSNAIQNAIVDAKGDLISATAADSPARLAVGANGTVLTADSAEATGLKWATASSGGMTLLNSGGTALSGASTTVSITPTGYVALKIYIKGAYSSADQRIFMRLNSDTGSNYSYTVWSNHLTNTGNLPGNGTTSFEYITRGNPTANTTLLLQNADIDLQFPNDTDFVTIQYQSIGGAAVGTFWQQSGGGVYDGTAAITGITFGVPSGTFSGGTIFVYGVK